MAQQLRVLIVGAGSVGQLYGHIFQRGGATVEVYVRPEYAEEAAEGFTVYDRSQGLDDPMKFIPEAVRTAPGQIRERHYDAIVLCIPSTGLRGEWIEEFGPATGEATVITLTPGLEDREFLGRYIDEERIGAGLITAVAYPAPMQGETAPQPGTAFWLPPMTPAFFEGPAERIDPVVSALKKGGMSARRVKNLARRAAFGSAVLIPFVAVLETQDWSLSKLRGDKEAMGLLADVVDEAIGAVEEYLGTKRPLAARLLSPLTFSGALIAAPKVPPFDLETYLRVHFTKVGEQTRLLLGEFVDQRERAGEDSPALQTLLNERTLD